MEDSRGASAGESDSFRSRDSWASESQCLTEETEKYIL